MSHNKWFRITCTKSDGSVSFHSYQFADSAGDARDAAMCWGPSEAKEVPGIEVPAVRRVLKEVSTEQLKKELKARGWSVTLSCT
jgi:hypothetical protein